ncbi:MAG: hypothetical protein Q9162_004371 [Coniocarpon cinnabarinum]
MEPTSAFFYGTLMSPQVLTRVTSRPPSAFKTRAALLRDHRRHRVKGADFPAVVPARGSDVRGTYVEGLNSNDIWRLDLFEGPMYERRNVKIQLFKTKEGSNSATNASTSAENAPKLPPGTQSHAGKPVTTAPGEDDFESGEVETTTYIWTDPIELLEPAEWDFAEFVREKLWRWAGTHAEAEGEYAEVDEAVNEANGEAMEMDEDPTRGRAVGGAFDEKLKQGPPT